MVRGKQISVVEVSVRAIPLPITGSTAAIAALQEGEAGTAAGTGATRAANDAPEDREHDERGDDDRGDDGPPEVLVNQQFLTLRAIAMRH